MMLLVVSEGVLAVTCPGSGFEVEGGVCIPTGTGLPDPGTSTPVLDILINFMEWALSIFGVVAIIAFIISGIQYLTATGDESRITTAKTNMKWSIVGVIVGLIGYIVITTIDAILNTYAII